jgi:Ubiquitin carboxyl-terminal hydrolase
MSPPPLNNSTSTSSSPSSNSISNQNMSLPHYQYGYSQMYHPMDPNSSAASQQHSRGGGMSRRGRARGGNNNINRRDFQMRQNNHHQQNQQPNEYGPPLIDQNQSVISTAPYQQFYIHYPPWQNAVPQNMNMTQNLTGQPLFAIQQPLLYQYGQYPIMYNVMPQAHQMPHQQPEMIENEVQEPIVWPPHPQQIFHHSPHLNAAELEFQAHPDEFQMNEYQSEEVEIDPNAPYVDPEEMYEENQQILLEKTRDLMIETNPQPDEDKMTQSPSLEFISPNKIEQVEPVLYEKVIDNKMIIKNVEKPPAWGNATVPNLSAQQKKQMASVSVSAIPNKDVEEYRETNVTCESNDVESKLTATSFSPITVSNQPIEGEKTEKKQNEVQQVLIERAKQQIVTTIIGTGPSDQENEKKVELSPTDVIKHQEDLTVEKSPQPAKVSQATSNKASSSSPSASWAGLFNSKTERSIKTSQPHSPQPSEIQKSSTAKNSESLLGQAPQAPKVPASTSQVPAMSYSAVSAQSATPATNHHSSSGLPQSKTLPIVNENSNNNNHIKTASVGQHATKLGGLKLIKRLSLFSDTFFLTDFFSKYKIESNSISLLPRGLLNKSNYCYINAILQALVSCPPFYHLMKAIPQMPSTYRNQTKTPVTDAMSVRI